MSHELRTPLNAILGFGQLLGLDPLSEEQRESVDQILRAGGHLLELINEVLEISRIEAGALRLSLEPVRIGGIVAEAVELVAPLAGHRGIAIHAGLGADGDRHVRADHGRLRQVLINLLSNAIKYNRELGSVTVRVGLGGAPDRLRISVTDTGPGLTADQAARVFHPFERLDAPDGVEGTGLGLPLSRALTEAMHGTLEVESQPGEGATFCVELAAAGPVAASARRDADGAAAPGLALSGQVLCIEDNPSNARLVQRILARHPGIALSTAPTGGAGLEAVRARHPDLVLLDLHLPDMPGDAVLAALKADPATAAIPVVILSADATHGLIDRLLTAGARAYLPKPLDVPRLLATLDSLLPHR
jgi:CheY-like chemotaxis protein/anti-sigma regulatory factor (Ser/Thr protein kinase)